jgi:uncharacterized protein (DUF2147 family)
VKKLIIVAALLMATTAAHAGNSISFEIGGQKIRIEAPKNCDALSCLQISAPGLSGSGFGFKSRHSDEGDDVAASTDQPAPKSPPPPVVQAAAPPAPVAAPVAAPAAPVSNPAPVVVAAAPPAPVVKNDAVPAVAPATTTAAPTATAAPATATAASVTPVGIWATEDNKGSVRVEPCGANLCGYAVKTGEKILINMKPSDTKWSGQIHDPDSGRDYSSTITMKGPNALRVQGCAFGGLFCGGQTWSRVS